MKTCPPVVFPYSYTIFLGSHTIFLNFYTILAITEFDSTISVDVTLARYREWMGWSVTHCGGGAAVVPGPGSCEGLQVTSKTISSPSGLPSL